MARKVQIVLEDDLDGGVADETVSFALDGVAYEIDLSQANANRLRDALATYVASARRASRTSARGQARSAGRGRAGGNSDTAAIREWARSQGIEVSERGRVSAKVREQYEAAMGVR